MTELSPRNQQGLRDQQRLEDLRTAATSLPPEASTRNERDELAPLYGVMNQWTFDTLRVIARELGVQPAHSKFLTRHRVICALVPSKEPS